MQVQVTSLWSTFRTPCSVYRTRYPHGRYPELGYQVRSLLKRYIAEGFFAVYCEKKHYFSWAHSMCIKIYICMSTHSTLCINTFMLYYELTYLCIQMYLIVVIMGCEGLSHPCSWIMILSSVPGVTKTPFPNLSNEFK